MSYADLNQEELFIEYRIESQSSNCILFELSLQNFLDALNSAKKAPQCQIKLTKRNGQAVLCVETRAMEIDVVHDIPVVVMRASEYEYYRPPDVPRPEVQLELPTAKNFKHVVDRLKNMARNVYLRGAMAGSLTLHTDTEGVSIRTFFTNLQPRYESLIDDCEENTCILKVDPKKLAMVLHAYTFLRFNSIIMCMVPNHSLILHVLLEPTSNGTLTFYLPIMVMGEDEAFSGNESMDED
eukprot:CAMPEP_0172602346 /NCGR_PEP_ID=MMETSP1068-20121228/22524_1 /TAXON_ID=35684 /ORGANISM="Pseudopedinella elastica, Strain CCMP716" /LENGTH=238 /DNA_ID=CAMNT_0013403651 /DNA_START=144 /DNA_END=860 /DNA_ORIENTATION=+